MAIFDIFALDGASDMKFQALLTGQQSSVACCIVKGNFNALSTCVIFFFFPRDLREHSSSTITMESEVDRRMITANTKVHNHRRRVDMILFAFDRRVALPK